MDEYVHMRTGPEEARGVRVPRAGITAGSGPLKEQYVLSITESSPQPHSFSYSRLFFYIAKMFKNYTTSKYKQMKNMQQ